MQSRLTRDNRGWGNNILFNQSGSVFCDGLLWSSRHVLLLCSPLNGVHFHCFSDHILYSCWIIQDGGWVYMHAKSTHTLTHLYVNICVLTHADTGNALRLNRYASLSCKGWRSHWDHSWLAATSSFILQNVCVCVWPSSIDVVVCAMSVFYWVCVTVCCECCVCLWLNVWNGVRTHIRYHRIL